MNKTIVVSLDGHAGQFRLDEDAYSRLADYLERAEARLSGDPDRAEVVRDLERSVGDKLATQLASADRVVTAADIDVVLEQIGSVETGGEPEPGGNGTQLRPRRRLMRIRERQQLTGVCAGLAAYADVNVDWVRTGFVLGTVVTAGIFGLV